MRFNRLPFHSAAVLGCSGAIFSALSLFSPAAVEAPAEAASAVTVHAPAVVVEEVAVAEQAPVAVLEIAPDIPADAEPAEAEAAEAVLLNTGRASYYAASLDGRPTASGEPYDHDALTAAHRTLPFGTRLLVRNERNGQEVVVTVNDRGPFTHGRLIDLSGAAARQLGMIRAGTARVAISELPG